MLSLVNMTVAPLDRLRFALLSRTMSSSVLRRIYLRRSWRLGVLFTICSLASLSLSVFFPFIVLAFGPLIYGVPHLFASARYMSGVIPVDSTSRLKFIILILLLAMMTGAGLSRILFSNVPTLSHLVYSLNIELVFSIALLVALTILRTAKVTLVNVMRYMLLLGFFVFIYQAPLFAAAILLVGHNFVAFFYWIHFAKTIAERRLAVAALGVFALINIAIFQGNFDTLLLADSSYWRLPSFGIDPVSIGRQVFPFANLDYQLFLRGACAYAFGQSLHYFIWLKVIPEQNLRKQIPTAFTESFRLLKRDFGKNLAFISILISVGGLFSYVLMEYEAARRLYLMIASFHGFAEIVVIVLFSSWTLKCHKPAVT